MAMRYTTIYHDVRKAVGLSCNEYCVADMVLLLSCNPGAPVPGWCNASRGYIAGELDISRQTVITIVQKLVSLDIVEENEAKYLRVTQSFFNSVTGAKKGGVKKLDTPPIGLSRNLTPDPENNGGCQETLQGVKKLDTPPLETDEGVKKLDTGCKETLQGGCQETLQGGVKKLDTITRVNNSKGYNEIDNLKKADVQIPAVADAPVFSEESDKTGVPEIPAPAVPAPPAQTTRQLRRAEKKLQALTTGEVARPVVTLIKARITTEIPGYYWTGRDGKAAKELAEKVRGALAASNFNTTDPDVVDGLAKLIRLSNGLSEFYQFKDIPQFNTRFNEIRTQLLKQANGTATKNSRVAPAHQTPQQRAALATDVFGAIDDYVNRKQGG